MKPFPINRRNLLTAGAAGAAGLLFARPKPAGAAAGALCIEEPFHGAVLNRRNGRQTDAGLQIDVSGDAPFGDRVTVNGIEARRAGTKFVCEYLTRNGLLKDFASGIVFSKYALVCNSTPVEQVAPILEPLAQNPWRAEIMDLFTHEQYFWPFYRAYLPDHAERLDVAIRWVTEHGYEPVFFHEGFLGITE